MIGKVKRRFI